MNTKDFIREHANEFEKLCQQYEVKYMYVFGSTLGENEANPANDVGLWDLLESFFQKKVDLVTNASLRNPYLKNNIETSKVLLYDGKSLKISF